MATIPASVADPVSTALAVPIDFEARYGAGCERALVLGGGGLWFVAWQVAYLHALTEGGVPVAKADRVIGTSAGSLVASLVSAGHLRRIATEVEFLARVPRLVGALAGEGDLHESQARAVGLFGAAADAEPATVAAIGHAALAAQAPPPERTRRSMRAVLAMRRWPAALHTTAVDAYTGERLVVDHAAGLSVARAAAASSAVPGIFSPQPLHDRRAMDGGVSGSGIHADLAAGSGVALVVSLSANAPDDQQAGMTQAPGGQAREIAALEATGTRVLLRGPRSFDLEALMDPAQVAAALADGAAQGAADVGAIAAAWA